MSVVVVRTNSLHVVPANAGTLASVAVGADGVGRLRKHVAKSSGTVGMGPGVRRDDGGVC
jgi:hypothetical protein